jgi:hypothetical protein
MKAKISRLVLPVLIMAVYVATANLSVEAWCPPKIQILTPCNTIYATASVPLTFTVNKAVSWIGYSLDGQANVTILGNTTLTTLQEGTHHVVVYANDTCGLMGASSTVYFSVDTLPPEITDVRQFPSKDGVYAEDEVMVNAIVTDAVSGVKSVSLFYAYANSSGIWISVVRNMIRLDGNVWSATLPRFPYGTNVTYAVSAEDNVGNSITTAEMGYDIQYHVIPEFLSFFELLFFAIAATAMVTFQKRRRST